MEILIDLFNKEHISNYNYFFTKSLLIIYALLERVAEGKPLVIWRRGNLSCKYLVASDTSDGVQAWGRGGGEQTPLHPLP